ncbi:MAG: PDZ domain-containing protein [Janthinobacterium lividum]
MAGAQAVTNEGVPFRPVLAAAMAHGSGTRLPGQGYLGIDIRDVSDSEVSALRLKSSRGAEIIMVDHDGPAGKAGLREHDVVLSVNGTLIDGEDHLRKILRELQPGRPVAIVVCRGGVEQAVNATMANRAELERQAWEQHWSVPDPARDEASVAPASPAKSGFGHGFMSGHLLPMSPTYTGATVDALGGQLADYFGVKDGKGLLVHGVEDNSPAASAGLHAGDVVTRINGDRVASKADWSRALHESKGHPVSLTVIRDRHEQMLTMVPDAKHRSKLEAPPPPVADRGWLSILLLR